MEPEQRPACEIAAQLAEIIGTVQPSEAKASAILALMHEAFSTDDAGGMVATANAVLVGLARDFLRGVDMQADDNRAFYGEALAALVALTGRAAQLVNERETAPSGMVLH